MSSRPSETGTIHLVLNAHIDPIWLWPWTSGLDAVLNTCESMCNLLDRNPDAVFTRGEAWVYEQVERIDPALFRRIGSHIRAGRWEIVGGWYIQPDCNLPEAEGFRRQIALGKAYFQSRFGRFPEIGYNVDSFGHATLLPRLMREAGQKYYVMMRPQEHERKLPARLFRWSGEKGGPEVAAFRIAGEYNNGGVKERIRQDILDKCVAELPPGLRHTMCFAGVGDHGGGPSEALLAWCRENRGIVPGWRLEFSSPSRFFRAVEKEIPRLPRVTGELQMHAVGCYSVHRAVKSAVRRAEHLLGQAGEALAGDRELAKRAAPEIEQGWRNVCFGHFHDTLGGTCVPSAYPAVEAQLGQARAAADETVAHALRRRGTGLPPDPRQRLLVGNFSGAAFEGWIEHEPWLEGLDWRGAWRVLDERGRAVPHQRLTHEAIVPWPIPRLLFRLKIPRGGLRVLRLENRKDVSLTPGKPGKPGPAAFILRKGAGGALRLAGKGLSWEAPKLLLLQDDSDTWSHGVDSYQGRATAAARWGVPEPVDAGPLMHAWVIEGKIGKSALFAEWRRYADEPFLELRLRVTWLEARRLLRLEWKPGLPIAFREDGVPGGGLRRESDGRERPVRDRSLLRLRGGKTAGALFPETFSLSGTRDALRLTLLRSALLAHHDPYPYPKIAEKRRTVSDRGEQAFLFRFYPAGAVTAARLDGDALALQRAPAIADLTRGMPGMKKK